MKVLRCTCADVVMRYGLVVCVAKPNHQTPSGLGEFDTEIRQIFLDSRQQDSLVPNAVPATPCDELDHRRHCEPGRGVSRACISRQQSEAEAAGAQSPAASSALGQAAATICAVAAAAVTILTLPCATPHASGAECHLHSRRRTFGGAAEAPGQGQEACGRLDCLLSVQPVQVTHRGLGYGGIPACCLVGAWGDQAFVIIAYSRHCRCRSTHGWHACLCAASFLLQQA